MRVLMLNERDLDHPLAGGVEVHLEEVAGRLAARHGIATTVLCAGFAGAPAEETRGGVRFVRLGSNRFSYYGLLPSHARREAASGGYDLLVENLCKLVFLSPLYVPDLPRLGLVHHLFGTSAFRQVAPPIALGVLFTESFLPLLYRDWPFIAVSPSTRDDLVARGIRSEQIRVIPNGLDRHRYRPRPGVAAESDRVVFVGRLEHYKGLDVLLDAWSNVRAARPQARLEILGAGTAHGEIASRIGGNPAEHGITLHGFVSDDEKIDWLLRASLVVQPSRKEGWGLTVLEANACGAPVVATDVPGLRDSVRDGESGLLVRPADAPALAAAIVRVLAEPSLRALLSSGARAWAARFSWDEVAAETARVLRAAASREALPAVRDFLAPVARAAAAGCEAGA
jgi:glycosyltransferase involved in cell wall biosynthesis